MTKREQLEQAIAALEAQRSALGDAAVDTALNALRIQLDQLGGALADNAAPEPAALGGERKLVTVMFADLSGFTALAEKLDPEAVRELINGCFNRLAPVVEKYQGVVDKFIGDEIMALFGAPVAHEQDPERALRAALEMMDTLGDVNAENETDLDLHIGINTGLVIAGGIGSDGRQQYSVMGDAVNLAARLKDAAQRGEVLVGLGTYRSTESVFDFESLQPISMKGKAEAVPVHRLRSPKSKPAPVGGMSGLRSPLVGRRGELVQLQTALEALRDGTGGIVAIIAEAGLGKSRLVAEARQVYAQGLAWVEGRALSYAQGISYGVAREVLLGLLSAKADDTPQEISDRLHRSVERLLHDRAADVHPFLTHLLDLPPDDQGLLRIKELTPEALQRWMQRAFAELVRAHARQGPLVLVWEDLHWADPSSLALLEQLLPLIAQAPVLAVLVFRSEGDRIESFRQRASETHGTRYQAIQLQPLTHDQSSQLAKNLLGLNNLPDAARRIILDKVEGNPFFLEEVLRSLLDAGLIVFEQDRAFATQAISEIDVPDSLHAVIAARIDRLPMQDKQTLQTSSVVGRVFQKRVLAKMMEAGRSGLRLDASLDELRRREFIRLREVEATGLEYIFKHVLIQEVTYNTLLIAQRKGLHRNAGEAIEALFPDRLDELGATVGYHFARAEVREKAVRYLRRAGDRARADYANTESIGFYRAAIDQVSPLLAVGGSEPGSWREHAAILHESLGDVLELTGQHEEARRAYQQSLENVAVTDRISQSRMHRKAAVTWQSQYSYEEAFRSYDSAEAMLGPKPVEPAVAWWQERVEIQINRLWAHYWRVQVDEMAERIERMQPVVELYGTPFQRSMFYSCLTMLALRRDRYVISDETLGHARAGFESSLRSGHVGQTGMPHFMLGFVLLWRNELDEAEENLRSTLAQTERTGDVLLQSRCLTYLTVLWRKRGSLEEVNYFARQTLQAAYLTKMPEYVGAAKANLAWVAWRAGKPGETMENARVALDSWQKSHAVYPFRWLALFPLIGVALQEKNVSQAMEYMGGLLQAEQMRLPDTLNAAIEQTVVLWGKGDLEAARDGARRALALAGHLRYI